MEQILMNGACRGASYALLAVGFSLIFLTTRVFHLAYSCTCVLAAYTVNCVVVFLGGSVLVGCIGAFATAAILGVIIEVGFYYPLECTGSSGTSLLLVSLAATITIENLISLIFGARPRVLIQPALPPLRVGNVVLTSSQYLSLVVALVVVPILYLIITRSKAGLLCRAVADAPESASILGIDVKRVRAAVVAFGSAIGGLGFVLHVSDGAVTPHAASQATIVAAISAGIARGGPTGAMLIAFVLGLTQTTLLFWLPTRWEPVSTAFILLLAVFLRPDGFRRSRRDDE